ncbi:YqcI/YcgG family-domain-containing protein [Mycena amicta]|nr:YqcI/YcgG family-domain-containing protein [Mycena amicta]
MLTSDTSNGFQSCNSAATALSYLSHRPRGEAAMEPSIPPMQRPSSRFAVHFWARPHIRLLSKNNIWIKHEVIARRKSVWVVEYNALLPQDGVAFFVTYEQSQSQSFPVGEKVHTVGTSGASIYLVFSRTCGRVALPYIHPSKSRIIDDILHIYLVIPAIVLQLEKQGRFALREESMRRTILITLVVLVPLPMHDLLVPGNVVNGRPMVLAACRRPSDASQLPPETDPHHTLLLRLGVMWKFIKSYFPTRPPPAAITHDELQRHGRTANNPWVAIDGQVYDVTDYCTQHPGGAMLRTNAGRDITQEFYALHNKYTPSVLKKLPMRGHLTNGHIAPTLQVSENDSDVAAAFRGWALSTNLPCVIAKAALARGIYTICTCPAPLGDASNAPVIAQAFNLFITRQTEAWAADNRYTTFVAVFPKTPRFADERDYEMALMQQLQTLLYIDTAAWPSDLPRDAQHKEFSFAFGGRGYFTVGLHPDSSRPGRRFEHAAIAFNANQQFARMRQVDEFEIVRRIVRKRDEKQHGSTNPAVAADLPPLQQASGINHLEDTNVWRANIVVPQRESG